MGSLGQPTPVAEERDSSRLIIGIAVFVVIAGALAAAFLLREPPKIAKTASPYIANLKLSDFKMSAAENFIGHTVSYIDGTITNGGDKTVTHAVVEVTFKDDIGPSGAAGRSAAAGSPKQRGIPRTCRRERFSPGSGPVRTFSPDVR